MSVMISTRVFIRQVIEYCLEWYMIKGGVLGTAK